MRDILLGVLLGMTLMNVVWLWQVSEDTAGLKAVMLFDNAAEVWE